MTDDIVLPVKRVEGETVEDRMTEAVVEKVLSARYLRRDETGASMETPAEMFERVATNVAAAERQYAADPDGAAARWAERFEDLMTGLEFVPNSPTLMNAGTDIQQLAACFVISPEDDLDSIFETVKDAARIFQTGGGVGYAFSHLRPRGDPVRKTGGVASGPVSFMSAYDEMCETIKQGGRRRGAQMGILRVDHPDVGRFCVAKREEGALENFNVSVAITDAFYEAVQSDEEYALVNPRTDDHHEVTEATAQFYNASYADAPTGRVEANLWRDYPEIEGIEEYHGDLVTVGEPMTLPAQFVWRLVVDGAWRNGEPGLFVIDQANRDHAFDVDANPDHAIHATNPCGEQPLEQFEACNLGHVNLSVLAADDPPRWNEFTGASEPEDLSGTVEAFLAEAVDWDRLDRVTRHGLRFLDDTVTMSDYPLAEIEETVGGMRKVGLGVMGFAELLLQFGVRYGSDASVEIARQLMGHIDREATRASHDLAAERGNFAVWPDSKYAEPTAYPDWFRRHTGEDPADWEDGYPIRNHGVTSVAPTGTTGMIANTSAGCEPLYSVVYAKNVGRDVRGADLLVAFDDYFLRVLDANGVDVDGVREEAERLLRAGEYTDATSLSVPDEIAEMFVTAHDVSTADHVRIQAAFQEHVDGAVSKTINAPHDATRDDVASAFELAVETGCKGLTLYRTESRRDQVLTTTPQDGTASSSESDSETGDSTEIETDDSIEDETDRPERLRCCPI